jgi:putative hydrolase of the HAD superfamily
MMLSQVTALTLDLDDTLWPVKPTAAGRRAHPRRMAAPERAGDGAGLGGSAGMLALRAQVAAERPDWAHDLTAIRLETIRRALRLHGDDPALAETAFEVFFEVATRSRCTRT